MKITQSTISNHAIFHEQYMKLIDAHHTLLTDESMHWCKENPNLDRLRSVAEKAVYEYMMAASLVYNHEEREITEALFKKRTLF